MQNQKKFCSLLVAFLLLPSFALGETKILTVYCPPISALTKDPLTKTWAAPGGFKSYDLSFVDSITGFLGAQWQGASVGQVTCVYTGLPEKSFNVLLVSNVMSFEPSTLSWGKNMGGYRNCLSRRRNQCPFTVAVKPKQDDIYQEIEKLKS